MGLPAYFTGPPGALAWTALGDANRGARSWPFAAVSNHERPAARTPRSSALLRFWCQTPLGSAVGGRTGVRHRASSDPARAPDRCQTPGYDGFVFFFKQKTAYEITR